MDSAIGVVEVAVAATARERPGNLRRLDTLSEIFGRQFDGRGAVGDVEDTIQIWETERAGWDGASYLFTTSSSKSVRSEHMLTDVSEHAVCACSISFQEESTASDCLLELARDDMLYLKARIPDV